MSWQNNLNCFTAEWIGASMRLCHHGRIVKLTLNEKKLAEREGFEPPVRFPVHLISSQAPSTARPPLHFLGVSFALPQTLKKLGEHCRCLAREHASGRRQLVIETLILT